MRSKKKWFRRHGPSTAIPQWRHGRSPLCLEALEDRTVLSSAGTLHPTFGNGGTVTISLWPAYLRGLVIQPDGKLIAVGGFYTGSSNAEFAVARFNPDGTLDQGFGTGGSTLTSLSTIPFGDANYTIARGVALQPDGKIILAGEYTDPSDFATHFGLVRYNADGSLDTSFGSGGIVETAVDGYDYATALALQTNGKIVVVGAAGPSLGNMNFAVVRYNADGTLDTTFGTNGVVETPPPSVGDGPAANAVLIQPDGKIVVGGHTSTSGKDWHYAVLRYNTDGSLDPTFGAGGEVLDNFPGFTDEDVRGLALQPDGKIVAVGRVVDPSFAHTYIALARYNADGSLDTSFNGTGRTTLSLTNTNDSAEAVALQTNGRIVVAGTHEDDDPFVTARFNADGTLDTTFGTGGWVTTRLSTDGGDNAHAVAIQPDGKIVTAGTAGEAEGSSGNFALARYFGDAPVPTLIGSATTPAITYGTPSITVAGNIASNASMPIPAGEVIMVTLNGATQNAPLDNNDNFSVDFDSSALGVAGSPYTITMTYAGDGTFSPATGSSTLTVNPAPLTITATDETKTYGQTLVFAGTEFTVGGLVNSDSVAQVVLASPGTAADATVAGSPYAITGSSAVGTGLTNYAISYVSGTLTVNPTSLTIAARDESKTYGQTLTFAGTEFTATGLLNSDSVSQVTLASPGAAADATVAGSPYAITASSAVGTGLGNYTITYVDGTLTVNPAQLVITAGNQRKTYGQKLTFAGTEFSASGLVNEDAVSQVSLVSSGSDANMPVAASPYAITPSAAVGTGLANYSITYKNGQLTVIPAALSFTIGNDTQASGVAVNLANDLVDTISTGVNNETLNISYTSSGDTATTKVGQYSIIGTLSNGTGALSNYSVALTNGTLTVTPGAPVRIVVSSGSGQSAGFGTGFGQSLVAEVMDINGDGVPGVQVTFAVPASGPGVQQSGVAATTGMDGTARLAITANGLVGSYQISAAASGIAGQATYRLTNLPATITGTVFQDANLNGVQDAGETGMAGQTVFIDVNGSGLLQPNDPITTTDRQGNYQFTVSMAGTYTVREVLLGGALLDTPAGSSYQVTVTTGTNVSGQNFAEVPTSSTIPLNLPLTTTFPKQGRANADFVEAVYRTVLDRNADSIGLANWTNALNSGALSRAQVVQGIRLSPEHFTQEVTDFYFTLLDRAPDSGGLQNWVAALESGKMTEEQVAFAFLDSPEYLSKGDKYFVDHMYLSLLGRTFDVAGEANWLNALGDDTSGNPTHPATATHAQLITAFLYSPESLKRLVEGYYQVYLRRLADPTGLNSWLTQLQQGASFLTIGQGFLSSNEFYNAAAAQG
jgi:uncharacterized delta-60 repeat protein